MAEMRQLNCALAQSYPFIKIKGLYCVQKPSMKRGHLEIVKLLLEITGINTPCKIVAKQL
jgi:hypothetical protein